MKFLVLTLIVLLMSIEPSIEESHKPIVVLELFTSQGCSSCPPADMLLNDIKKTYDASEVLALSYHVDYWNYIGWKDPFSKAEFSDVQRAYGRKFNSSTIYTPQMVINGKEHFVGSKADVLTSKVKSYLQKNAENSISISHVKKEGSSISFSYNVEGTFSKKQLRVALVVDERTTSVSRGENKNRSLKNSNIVVEQIQIDLKSNMGKGIIDIPKLVIPSDKLTLIVLIETADLDVVGGGQFKL